MTDRPEGVARRFRREAHRWDEIYSDSGGLLARAWDRLTRSNVRRRFARTFEAGGDLRGRSVLDLGCGSGRYLVEAAQRGAGRIVGVDFAPEMLAAARALAATVPSADRIELVCADLADLQLQERFDLVIANGLFDYLPDPRSGFLRAAGWTRGVLVASFPDRRAPRALPRSLYWRLRGVRIQLFGRAGVERLAEEAGFHDRSIERIGPIFLLLARAGGKSPGQPPVTPTPAAGSATD
jgi:SAM-dependent methyltransferase